MKTSLRRLARLSPAYLVLAVPVAPANTLEQLKPLADEIICLASPKPFEAVGVHYRDFTQTTDAEVVRGLRSLRAPRPCRLLRSEKLAQSGDRVGRAQAVVPRPPISGNFRPQAHVGIG